VAAWRYRSGLGSRRIIPARVGDARVTVTVETDLFRTSDGA
jgi:hypothetical protein